MKIYFKILLLLCPMLLFYACKSNFIVQNATHKQIVISEGSNSEQINVFVTDVNEAVVFDYIVYNKQKMKVSTAETKDGITKISAIKQNGAPLIIGEDNPEVVDKPNQLVYTINGKQKSVLIEDIEYLPTKTRH